MARYFTSDLHLGSTNILKYAKRPFSSAEDALASSLININGNLSRHDILIHVGDFMLAGADRHDKDVDIGLRFKLDDYIDMIEPKIILLAGNHDDSHNCEAHASCMTLNLNQNYFNVTVGHYPSNHEFYRYVGNNNRVSVKDHGLDGAHIHLCGHVHDSWFIFYDRKKNVINYNVGIDVHDYKPVRDSDITSDLDYIRNAEIRAFDKMTRKEFEDFKRRNDAIVRLEREKRKEEKYKKRGLTPEECERRKHEAMVSKGLI